MFFQNIRNFIIIILQAGERIKKKINEQRKKPLEKELITRHMQLGTIAAN